VFQELSSHNNLGPRAVNMLQAPRHLNPALTPCTPASYTSGMKCVNSGKSANGLLILRPRNTFLGQKVKIRAVKVVDFAKLQTMNMHFLGIG